MQNFVGGLIECIPLTDTDSEVTLVCNDEGKLLNVDFILKGINEYLMALAKEQIKLAFEQSEKEVADLHQRTREGLVTAKLNGKQVGRKKGTGFETKKSKAAKEKIRIHCKAFGGTLDDVECMKLTGLARNTYYKYKRQIREEVKTQG